jgi:antitoxin (DNA-binding transcriptional repressor) of toxin-antitoxin stability system
MKTISATELARNLRRVLDRVVADGEEIVIERNHEQIARLVAGPGRQNALDFDALKWATSMLRVGPPP